MPGILRTLSAGIDQWCRRFADGLPLEDARQEAAIAILHAVRCYQPRQGDFLPYALVIVRRRLLRALRRELRQQLPQLAGDVAAQVEVESDAVDRLEEVFRALPAEDVELLRRAYGIGRPAEPVNWAHVAEIRDRVIILQSSTG